MRGLLWRLRRCVRWTWRTYLCKYAYRTENERAYTM